MRINAPDLYSFSLFGLRIVLAFCVLVLAFRGTLPFGDEPDFEVRAVELVENEFPAWTPYHWLSGSLQRLDVRSNCVVMATPTAITARIYGDRCSEETGQILGRSLLMILLVSPVLIVVAWRGLARAVLIATVKEKPSSLNQRIDALGLSLLMPGMIFYLGLLSHEQLTLLISLFVFFFWGSWLIVASLLALIWSLDMGNAVVVATFAIIYMVTTKLANRLGFKWATLMVGLLLLSAYVSGVEGLTYLQHVPLLEPKVTAILHKAVNADFHDKYPVILRPLVTLLTGIFMTPSGVKILPLYAVYGVGLIAMVTRLRLRLGTEPDLILLLSVLTTIMLFTFLMPDYANAKYYIFLAPFVVQAALTVFSRAWVFGVLVSTAWMVPFGLMIFRWL